MLTFLSLYVSFLFFFMYHFIECSQNENTKCIPMPERNDKTFPSISLKSIYDVCWRSTSYGCFNRDGTEGIRVSRPTSKDLTLHEIAMQVAMLRSPFQCSLLFSKANGYPLGSINSLWEWFHCHSVGQRGSIVQYWLEWFKKPVSLTASPTVLSFSSLRSHECVIRKANLAYFRFILSV